MNEEIIDYAKPMLEIEDLLRKVHDACLQQNYKEAIMHTQHMATKAIHLLSTLVQMKERAHDADTKRR